MSKLPKNARCWASKGVTRAITQPEWLSNHCPNGPSRAWCSSRCSSRLVGVSRSCSIPHRKLTFKQNFVFEDVPRRWTGRLGSENAAMPIELAARGEVADSNPPVVWLPINNRPNGNSVCTEFRSVGNASVLFTIVPMPVELEWLRWSP